MSFAKCCYSTAFLMESAAVSVYLNIQDVPGTQDMLGVRPGLAIDR